MLSAIANFFLTATIAIVPEHRVDEFRDFMKSMTKKAAKLQAQPLSYVQIGDLQVMPKLKTVIEMSEFGPIPTTKLVHIPCAIFLVDGMTPKVTEKYELAARIDFDGTDKGALVATVPGKEVPDTYRAGRNYCDHCGKVRNRKVGFVLRNTETGEFIQVGGQCIVDFLGTSSMKDLSAKFTFLQNVQIGVSSFDEDEDGGRGYSGYTTSVFMFCVLTAIENNGGVFLPSKADGSTVSKASAIYHLIKNNEARIVPATYEKGLAILKEAQEILASKSSLSDYEYNLKMLVDSQWFKKGAGTLASLPQYLDKQRGIAATRGVKHVSEYIGTVGKRENFVLTITGKHSFEGYYGFQTIYTFRDEIGNVLVWKTGEPVGKADGTFLTEGDKIEVKATVKAHSLYREVQQTVLTRASVLTVF